MRIEAMPAHCRPAESEVLANPAVDRSSTGTAAILDVLPDAGSREAMRAIQAWQGYRPTPLRALSGLARQMGVASLHYKDEASRFGLGSFKALGGAYAVERQVAAEGRGFTVTSATDGNHGRSVAWGARRFGCPCVIYIHAGVSDGRKRAIEAYGAEVRRISGNYDDSVRRAAEDAALHGWTVISDTSYGGYTDIPRDVMQGYTVMVDEALDQLAIPPTHVLIQGGVGGAAAAVTARLASRYGPRRPSLIVVEPSSAACLLASARAGKAVTISGDLDTVMAGLSCGEPSLIAWDVLHRAADWFMTVPDHAATTCMKILAEGVGCDEPMVAGESGVAGLAGAITLAAVESLSGRLGIGTSSRLLVFGTEGATDPELYKAIVGKTPTEIEGESQ